MLLNWLKRLLNKRKGQGKEQNMPDINLNTKNLIKYYCSLEVEPEYALLVKGPWGCGKSHLVKDCIEDLKQENQDFKFLYVSLYGINEISDIEAKLFEQLNPVLSNKKVMFASQIAKGVLKGTLKIDLDDDGKPDASASIGVPDINLADYFTNTKNCILVFDDLERCELDLQLILGYINYFVEKEGYKVLIIADEEKIINQDSSREEHYKYTDIKEKLIGKTVKVEPDVSLVFDNFVNDLFATSSYSVLVKGLKLKELLIKNKELIISIFTQSNYNNLRSLRKTILDLKLFEKVFDDEITKATDLTNQFFKLFVALSMEVHSGKLKVSNIRYLLDTELVIKFHVECVQNETKNEFAEIANKYDVDFRDSLIGFEVWHHFFDSNMLDIGKVKEQLKLSKHFQGELTPSWVRLWYWRDLENDEFDHLSSEVWNKLLEKELPDLAALKHVAGIFFSLANEQLSSKTPNEVVDAVSQYLEHLLQEPPTNYNDTFFDNLIGYDGNVSLGYQSKDSQEFKEVSSLIDNLVVSMKSKKVKQDATKLLETIYKEPHKAISFFDRKDWNTSHYFDIPILAKIDTNQFLESMLKMPNKDLRRFCYVLSKRHESVHDKRDALFSESDWLKSMLNSLDKVLSIGQMDVSKVILKNFKQDLANSLQKLNNIEDAEK